MRCCSQAAIAAPARLAGDAELAAHLDRVEVAVAADDDLVLADSAAMAGGSAPRSGREDVDAADDQHVVAAADDLADAAHERARGGRQGRVRSRVR